MFGDIGQRPEDGFVLKSDKRTRVWYVQSDAALVEGNPVVVKEYQDPPFRQRLAWLLRIHPGQREARLAMRLAGLGIKVPVPVKTRWEAGRVWLVYPWLGPSLMNVVRQHDLSIATKASFADQISQHLVNLLENDLFNRDHKLSNILVDDDSQLWLVDVGGVRRARGRHYLIRMLGALWESARRAGASQSDCWRVVHMLAAQWPDAGDAKSLAKDVLALHEGRAAG